MRIIITESQLSLLLEQSSNVYTDINEYKKALKIYNKKMAVYQMSLELYKERVAWSKDFSALNPAFNTPNMTKLSKLTNFGGIDIPYFMDAYYRCINNLTLDNGLKVVECNNAYTQYKNFGSPKIEKWNKIPTYIDNGKTFDMNIWTPIFEKPNIEKPIFKKPEPVAPVKPPVTKTPPVINYREIKSQLTFAPQFKTGTPVIELNIPGGPYYLTYPEFEEYKKTRTNTTFKKT